MKKLCHEIKMFLHKDIYLAIGINISALLVCLILFYPQSEAGDDSVMYAILAGGYGERNSYIVYINILLSKCLKIITGIFPAVNWYLWFQYGFICISLSVITFILIKKFGNTVGLVFASVIVLYFTYESYILYQFSKTAGVLTCAGCFAIFYAIENEYKERLLSIIGAALVIIGFLYRYMMCLCVLGVFCVFGVYKCLVCLKTLNKNEIHKVLKYVIIYVSTMTVCLACWAINSHAYNSNEGWANYKEYNSYRSKIRDYPILEYEGNEEEYRKIGMSENDYNNLKNWNLADPEFYTIDLYQDILDITETHKDEITFTDWAKVFFENYPRKFFSVAAFRAYLCIVILVLFGISNRKRAIAYIGGSVAAGYVITAYLYWSGRYGLNRIDMSIWLAVILLLLCWVQKDQLSIELFKSRSIILLVAGLILCSNIDLYIQNLKIYNSDYVEDMESIRAFYDEVNGDKESIYFMDATNGFLGCNFYALEAYPEGYCENMLWLGGWYFESPTMKLSWQRNGITNPFKDIVNNPNMYMVVKNSSSEIVTIEYIREHYVPDAELSLVRVFNDYKIYQIVS